jgi:hypothetical protein
MSAIRLAALAILAVVGVSLFTAQPALARDGGCLPQPGYGCITQNNAYENKYCSGSGCMTCSPEPDAVCTGCGGDLDDVFNPSFGC